jgi:hypothetical protein
VASCLTAGVGKCAWPALARGAPRHPNWPVRWLDWACFGSSRKRMWVRGGGLGGLARVSTQLAPRRWSEEAVDTLESAHRSTGAKSEPIPDTRPAQ